MCYQNLNLLIIVNDISYINEHIDRLRMIYHTLTSHLKSVSGYPQLPRYFATTTPVLPQYKLAVWSVTSSATPLEPPLKDGTFTSKSD